MVPIALVILPYLATGRITEDEVSEVQKRAEAWLSGRSYDSTSALDLHRLIERIIEDIRNA